jgi:prevent-host-death family protein
MITTSISETRRRLSELIELARRGEEVVIIKDSRPVAALTPISSADLEMATRITDEQARRFHAFVDAEKKTSFPSAKAAVASLQKMARKRR